ncbi:FAD-binding oxidoreductase [Ancylobacter sp. MQZ15Z-1]|uniref:FAD-binding oxidoreductase n=1 Tax=Ancylobacter mangrovi TaxID=2972472 RepID=A0A9X2P9H5_9HYPH|nr:FAD-dependent oxidoreductase [Ancylobacter mangrovi]MCS0494534.1 FAD-binding oxidoreductase [Ancylobacter mangrovi]
MSQMHTDVVIIGAGSIGTLTALYLVRQGLSVVLLDRGFAGGQSTGVSPGSLRLQGRNPTEMPLSMRAQEMWEAFEDDIGESVEFEQKGHLFLALTPAHLDKIDALMPIEAAHGNFCEKLSRDEVLSRWPCLTPENLGGMFNPRSAVVNSRMVAPAVARAASRAGALLFEQEEVLSVERKGETFLTRTDRDRRIESPIVVNAAGMWARPFANGFGEDAPMFSAGPIQMVTEPVPQFLDPVVHSVDGHIIFRQTLAGNIVVAGHPRVPVDDVARRSRVPPDKTLRNMRRLLNAAPGLLPQSIIRIWTGIEGYLPDMLPVLGPSATTPGLFHAFGWSGHGLQCAPAAAESLTQLIVGGASRIDLSPFAIARFTGAVRPDEQKLRDEFEDNVVRPRSGAAAS